MFLLNWASSGSHRAWVRDTLLCKFWVILKEFGINNILISNINILHIFWIFDTDFYAYVSHNSARAFVVSFINSRAGCCRAYYTILCIHIFQRRLNMAGRFAHGPTLLSLELEGAGLLIYWHYTWARFDNSSSPGYILTGHDSII